MQPGIYSDISMAAYLQDALTPEPALSSSIALKLVTQSPLHAYAAHPRLGGAPPDLSNVADIGSVAHDILLGGEKRIAVIDPAEYRSKPTKDNPSGNIPLGWTNDAIREARDKARADGRTPILISDMDEVRRMVDSAHTFLDRTEYGDYLLLHDTDGACEQTIIWREGDTWCKARPDWMQRGICLHLKTTKVSVRPEPFIRGVFNSMGYGFMLRWYARGLSKAIEQSAYKQAAEWLHFVLAIEQDPPYACSMIGLAPDKAAYEDSRVERAIQTWTRCVRKNHWPAYDSRVHYAEATPWELAEAVS